MSGVEDKNLSEAVKRSVASKDEDEIYRRVLEISKGDQVASKYGLTTSLGLEIEASQVTPPVQATSADADVYVAMVENAIEEGRVGRFTTRMEQTQILQEQYGRQIEIGFEYAEIAYSFPQLFLGNVTSAPADGNCLIHAVQKALPKTHPLHVKDANTTSMEEIHALRKNLCGNVLELDVDVRRQLYPQMTDAMITDIGVWAKKPPPTKSWEYSEHGHLILLLEHAKVSCAVYDLQEKSWMFLNTSASMGYSVVLVKTELHYASVAIHTIEDQIQVHCAMQRAAC